MNKEEIKDIEEENTYLIDQSLKQKAEIRRLKEEVKELEDEKSAIDSMKKKLTQIKSLKEKVKAWEDYYNNAYEKEHPHTKQLRQLRDKLMNWFKEKVSNPKTSGHFKYRDITNDNVLLDSIVDFTTKELQQLKEELTKYKEVVEKIEAQYYESGNSDPVMLSEIEKLFTQLKTK